MVETGAMFRLCVQLMQAESNVKRYPALTTPNPNSSTPYSILSYNYLLTMDLIQRPHQPSPLRHPTRPLLPSPRRPPEPSLNRGPLPPSPSCPCYLY